MIAKCYKCKIEKELSEFHKDNARPNQRRHTCKMCVKIHDSARYHRDPTANKAQTKAYRKTANGAASISKATKKYKKNNPNKYWAHWKTTYAIKSKKLFKQPCEECGEVRVHAHHDDYLKPLNVRWLCTGHHQQWHAKHGTALNG